MMDTMKGISGSLKQYEKSSHPMDRGFNCLTRVFLPMLICLFYYGF